MIASAPGRERPPSRDFGRGRLCASCGHGLSRYNAGPDCGPCSKPEPSLMLLSALTGTYQEECHMLELAKRPA